MIMTVTAQQVSELRARTGVGLMDCKRVLVESSGDLDEAIKMLREKGLAKAAKKSDRSTNEGKIFVSVDNGAQKAIIIELNCETDFVANDKNFIDFSSSVAEIILEYKPLDVSKLKTLTTQNGTIEELTNELSAKVGEKIDVRRFVIVDKTKGFIGTYLHGARIGVIVVIDSENETVVKDVAMHVAATNPIAVDGSGIAPELLENEKEIQRSQANESGKPPEIIEKIISGRMKKFVAENTLLGQTFVKDNEKTISKYLKESGSNIIEFHRFEVGEGIEKKRDDFAKEVAAQTQRAKEV